MIRFASRCRASVGSVRRFATASGTVAELPHFGEVNDELLPPMPMKWTRLPDPPVKIRGTSAAAMTAKGLTLFTRRRGIALQNDAWSVMPRHWSMPGMVEQIAKINNYQLFLFGKVTPWLSRVLKTKVFIYDLEKNTCTRLDKSRPKAKLPKSHALMPMQKSLAVAPCFLGSTLYAFGDPDRTLTLDDLKKQSISTGVATFDLTKRDEPFRRLKFLPPATKKGPASRKEHFSALYDEPTQKIYLINQEDGLSYTTFDPATQCFSETRMVGSTWRARRGFATAIIRDAANVPYLIVYGGFAKGIVQDHIEDVDVLNLATHKWYRAVFEPNSARPKPRREAGACATSPHTLAVFGGRTHFLELDDVWLLSFVS